MTLFKGSGSGRKKSRRKRVRSGDLIVLLIAAVVIIIVYNYQVSDIVGVLYNPWVGVVLVIMILEFLILKSGDRTRVYRLELDKLRESRRKDEDLLKKARTIIDQSIEYPESEEEGRPGDWLMRAKDVVKDIGDRL